jgi:hypothetical protein
VFLSHVLPEIPTLKLDIRVENSGFIAKKIRPKIMNYLTGKNASFSIRRFSGNSFPVSSCSKFFCSTAEMI